MTVCARDRRCLFGKITNRQVYCNRIGRIIEACWREIPAHFPNVMPDAFVVMPNHVHGVLLFTDSVGVAHARPLPVVVGAFKAAVSRRAGFGVWQRNYFEHIVRNEDELNLIRHYIDDDPLNWTTDEENPVKAGAPQRPAQVNSFLGNGSNSLEQVVRGKVYWQAR